jgi:uncharacterized protein
MRLMQGVVCAIALFMLTLGAQGETKFPEHPSTAGFVNDFAGLLTLDEEQSLEHELRSFESETKVELAVVTVDSLQGDSVEDYAHGLFRKWGIGKAGADNGVLLLVAPNERKVRIEVGRRLEGILTDADSKMILHYQVVPLYKSGKHYDAIAGGVHAIIAKLSPALAIEGKEIMSHASKKSHSGVAGFIVVLLIMAVLVVAVFVLLRRKPKEEERPSDRYKQSRSYRESRQEERSRPMIVPIPVPISRKRDEGGDSSSGKNSSSKDDDDDSGITFGGGDSGGGGASDDL